MQVSAIRADAEHPPTEHRAQHFSCQFLMVIFNNLMMLSKLLSYQSILLRNDKCEINQFLSVFQGILQDWTNPSYPIDDSDTNSCH